MPKGKKYVAAGARRRTIICPCGWTSQDEPNACNAKFKLHKKHCSLLEALNLQHTKPTPFNKDNADHNGWNLQSRGQAVNSIKFQAMNVQLQPFQEVPITQFNEMYRS